MDVIHSKKIDAVNNKRPKSIQADQLPQYQTGKSQFTQSHDQHPKYIKVTITNSNGSPVLALRRQRTNSASKETPPPILTFDQPKSDSLRLSDPLQGTSTGKLSLSKTYSSSTPELLVINDSTKLVVPPLEIRRRHDSDSSKISTSQPSLNSTPLNEGEPANSPKSQSTPGLRLPTISTQHINLISSPRSPNKMAHSTISSMPRSLIYYLDTVVEMMQRGQDMYGLAEERTILEKQNNKDERRHYLKQILKQLREPVRGIKIKDRTSRLRKYPQCFLASNLVNWIVNNLNKSVNEAIDIGRELEQEGFIYHISHNRNFENSDLFFRFQDDSSPSSPRMMTPRTFTNSGGDVTRFYDVFWGTTTTEQRRLYKNNVNSYLRSLASYVPRLVLRRFNLNNNKVVPPESHTYPACVLFADISGFTPLTESLSKLEGNRGVELLTGYLNDYFGQLINLIINHGGDVVKFAGDALLSIFPTSNDRGLPYMIAMASQCALEMLSYLGRYEAGGNELTLHIGIGAGHVTGVHVGGVNDRIEFILAGEPLDQVAACEKAAASGEVYISHYAASLVSDIIKVSVPVGKNKKMKKIVFSSIQEPQPYYHLEEMINKQPLPDTFYENLWFEDIELCISPYVPSAVTTHLKSGAPDNFLAELRRISVIFVNLELQYSNDVLPKLQSGMCAMQEAIYQYEGTVRQFIIDDKGSVLIAAFGLPPLAHEDDPIRAVKSSILLREKLKQLGIGTSIGITTGRVFCGAVGSEERREYAVVGDLVNLSARLMAKAGGQILTDISTSKACESCDEIDFANLGSITVKGKSLPIQIFSPSLKQIGKDHRRTMILTNGIITPIVGRSKQISMITKAIESIQSNNDGNKSESASTTTTTTTTTTASQPAEVVQINPSNGTTITIPKNGPAKDITPPPPLAQLFLVHGEAGMGKSRLLEEIDYRSKERNLNVVCGSGTSIEKDTLYFAWKDIISCILFDTEDISMFKEKRKIDMATQRLKSLAPKYRDMAPLLNSVIPLLHFPSNITTDAMMSASVSTSSVLHSMLLMILKNSPIDVILIDNAQWMDSSSWKLLLAAASKLTNKVIVVAVRQLNDLPQTIEFSELENCTVLKLEPLTNEQIKELVFHHFARRNQIVDSLAPKFVQVLAERGLGNPFLIQELVDTLYAENSIVIKNKMASLSTSSSKSNLIIMEGSGTLRSLIVSKVDRLPGSLSLILKYAVVIGKTFRVDLLCNLLPPATDKSTVQISLDELEKNDFIEVSVKNPLTYSIKQAMVQEIVYDMMTFGQRINLHKEIATWYEKNMLDSDHSMYSVLAHHWMKAEVSDKAVNYLGRAGEYAMSTSNYWDSVKFLMDALILSQQTFELNFSKKNVDMLDSNPFYWTYIHWHRCIGQAYYFLGQYEKSEDFLFESLQLMNKPLNSSFSKDVYKQIKSYLKDFNKNKDTLRINPRLLKRSRSDFTLKNDVHIDDMFKSCEYIAILITLFKIYYHKNDKDSMINCAYLALKSAENLELSRELCDALSCCIISLGVIGKPKSSEKCISAATSTALKLNDVDESLKAEVHRSKSLHLINLGALNDAISECENAIKIYNKLGDNKRSNDCSFIICTCHYYLGDFELAMSLTDKVIKQATKDSDSPLKVWGMLLKGTIAYDQSDFDMMNLTMNLISKLKGMTVFISMRFVD
eukprot:TRINITY_DN1498_c1_g1_i1.p1 TRINITY_DN1498_c1_g1~~TRINITY_DN1498_c1_g1_i1.p1  ORF type:complete len:1676 (-),score=371.59 TRINITY_DN1498_c1_g1_i1:567-5594(-)